MYSSLDMKVGTGMGAVKRTLSQAIRNWEARKLLTAKTEINRKKQLERVWPHPLTDENRRKFGQGVRGLLKHSEE